MWVGVGVGWGNLGFFKSPKFESLAGFHLTGQHFE